MLVFLVDRLAFRGSGSVGFQLELVWFFFGSGLVGFQLELVRFFFGWFFNGIWILVFNWNWMFWFHLDIGRLAETKMQHICRA